MITVLLKGGLGNQMFQAAFGYARARGCGARLLLNRWALEQVMPGVTPRHYELDVYHLSLRHDWIEECSSPVPMHSRFLGRLAGQLRLPRLGHYVCERGKNFDSRYLAMGDGVIFEGYWQSEKYFISYVEEIRRLFDYSACLSDLTRGTADLLFHDTQTVAISIRRGDYVTNANAARHHGTMPLEYYERALTLLRERVGEIRPVIFSDDGEWAEMLRAKYAGSQIIGPETYGADYHAKHHLMQCCTHHVIANSSFSWWAAWLRSNPAGTVIAPRQWFAQAEAPGDLLPVSWIRL